MAPEKSYYVAYAVLVAIPLIILAPLFISSLWTVPQGKDTARRGFRWMKIALGLMSIAVILQTVAAAYVNRWMDDDWYYDTRDELYRLQEIMDRVSDWADFFGKIGMTLTWLAALEVGLGVVYCWDVGRSARTIVQWVAYLFVFVEIVFTFVILGFWEHFYTLLFRYYRDFSDLSYPDVEPLYRLYKVQATYSILLGVAATALLGFAIALVIKARRHTSQRQTSVLVLIASIFFWISSLWNMAIAIIYYIEWEYINSHATLIVNPILSIWFVTIALALLYVAGRRRVGGLWSKGQHA